MIASAIGASHAVTRLIAAAKRRNATVLATRAVTAAVFETRRCRVAVRGFFWSSDQSATRLNNIAEVRAHTMQMRTSNNVRREGRPSAATRSAPRANGRAKIVWEKRMRGRKREA